MSYGEWCPKCGAEIISVTRGIPSMGTCKNGHVTDRRDTLRRKPEPAPDLAAQVVRLTEDNERLRCIADAYDELLATVKGECPSLINEDSGGSAVLIDLIIKAKEARAALGDLK